MSQGASFGLPAARPGHLGLVNSSLPPANIVLVITVYSKQGSHVGLFFSGEGRNQSLGLPVAGASFLVDYRTYVFSAQHVSADVHVCFALGAARKPGPVHKVSLVPACSLRSTRSLTGRIVWSMYHIGVTVGYGVWPYGLTCAVHLVLNRWVIRRRNVGKHSYF